MVFFSFTPRCNSTADLVVRPEQLSPGDSVFRKSNMRRIH